jgi:hypothetical protein
MLRVRRSALAAIVAAVLVLTGVVATTHGHVPGRYGWQTATPTETASHDDGFASCSICRLAHETSTAPATPGVISAPLPRIAVPTDAHYVTLHAVPTQDHSPRAPPCEASC